jgi:hypothetical protein
LYLEDPYDRYRRVHTIPTDLDWNNKAFFFSLFEWGETESN